MGRITSAYEMIEQLWGIRTSSYESPAGSTAGLTASLLMKSEPRRLSFTITNLSSNSMYIAFTDQVNSNYGILVGANGGIVNYQWDIDFDIPTKSWWIIAAGAASPYYLQQTLSSM